MSHCQALATPAHLAVVSTSSLAMLEVSLTSSVSHVSKDVPSTEITGQGSGFRVETLKKARTRDQGKWHDLALMMILNL